MHEAGLPGCAIVVPGGWLPSPALRRELARLAPNLPVRFGAAEARRPGRVLAIAGDRLPEAPDLAAALADGPVVGATLIDGARGIEAVLGQVGDDAAGAPARLDAAGALAVRRTAKPGDGLVSRTLNRPVSQFISRHLLGIPGVRPIHATIGTGLIAVAMAAALVTGTQGGLLAGALLFHAASVFDGVDGEISRVTFRTSRSGAMLDSLIDAATNLAFLLGVGINLRLQGDETGAWMGFAGLAMLAIGLLAIGRASARSGSPFGFDVVKDFYRGRAAGAQASSRGGSTRSRAISVLTCVTSRDFFALAFAVMIVAGLARAMMGIFAASAACWLVAVGYALLPRRG